ncbi:MAG TPA: hypothetical protein VGD75_20645 [Bradyrhizobium sp.]
MTAILSYRAACPSAQSSEMWSECALRNSSGFRPAAFGEPNSLSVGGHAQWTGFLESLTVRPAVRQLEDFGESLVGLYGRIMNI